MTVEWLNFGATLAAIIVGGFIAYHIYFLHKSITFRDKIRHAQNIRDVVQEKIYEIQSKGLNHEVMLVNIRRYNNDYVGENTKDRHGYVELKAELKSVRYDGVEFFESMPQQSYYDSSKKITLRKTKNKAYLVYPVGLVPYEWIEHIDMHGDEFRYVPIFFVKFAGKDKYPYKYISYYMQSENYDEKNDPFEMKYTKVEL